MLPNARARLKIRDVIRILVGFVARLERLLLLRGTTRPCWYLLPIKSILFFIDGIRHLCRLPVEVEIICGQIGRGIVRPCSTKCSVIEVIVCFVELVTETIIGVLKINAAG